jgi:hypothetical protein
MYQCDSYRCVYIKHYLFMIIFVKVKLSRYCHTGNKGRVQLLLILDLCVRWDEWSASRPGRAIPPGKGPPVPIVQEAGRASELVWAEPRRKILCLCRGPNAGRPVRCYHLTGLS